MDAEIGQAAGTIWATLAEQPEVVTLSALKRMTKLSDQLLLMGLGWLAREDKVALARRSRGLEISLRQP
jgi:hypothetical protein